MERKGLVTAQVVTYIKNNIRSGSWIVGEKIPSENELCRQLNVSRVTVRNALQQFIAQGILESVHGKGTFLQSANLTELGTGKEYMGTHESAEDIRILLEFRSMIEPGICAAVAGNASPALLAKMEESQRIMEQSRDDNETFVEHDIRFHMAICEETHNSLVIQVMSDIFEKRRDACKILRIATGYYGGVYYHALILDAFRKHDAKQAKAWMKEHLERGMIDVSMDAEER